ncbi:hypothetical protein DL98DRAFT_577756 [Cadophora sp. DSE1049]|nr:hypothetical protein DL98DRAFT_577756 [Cadophora sp. DSE1049]
MYRPRKKMRLWADRPSSSPDLPLSRETSVPVKEQQLEAKTLGDGTTLEIVLRNYENIDAEHFTLNDSRASVFGELQLLAEARQDLNPSPQRTGDSHDKSSGVENGPRSTAEYHAEQFSAMDWQDSDSASPAASSVVDGSDDEAGIQESASYNMADIEDSSSASLDKTEYSEFEYYSDDGFYSSTAGSSPRRTNETVVTSNQSTTNEGTGEILKDLTNMTEWDSQLASLLLFFRNSDDIDLINCYGMAHNCKAKVLNALPTVNATPELPVVATSHVELQLRIEENAILLGTLVSEATAAAGELAVINEETTKVLKTLLSLETCYLKALVSAEAAMVCSKGTGNIHQNVVVPFDVVVYGQSAIRQSVDRILYSSRLYLQHPCSQEPNTLYDNPHFLKEEDIIATSGGSILINKLDNPKDDSDSEDLLVAEEDIVVDSSSGMANLPRVARVFNSLTRFKILKRLEADAKITTPLKQ